MAQSGGWELSLGDIKVAVRGQLLGHGQLQVQLGERRIKATVVASGERRQVFVDGHAYALQRVPLLDVGGGAAEQAGGLRSPMPGKIVALLVAPGSSVEEGTPLLVMEAMKMEHTITAPARGVVKAFCCAAGDQVTDGIELVEFEAESVETA